MYQAMESEIINNWMSWKLEDLEDWAKNFKLKYKKEKWTPRSEF